MDREEEGASPHTATCPTLMTCGTRPCPGPAPPPTRSIMSASLLITTSPHTGRAPPLLDWDLTPTLAIPAMMTALGQGIGLNLLTICPSGVGLELLTPLASPLS